MWFLAYATMGLLMFVGVLLMVIILLQRGRGGGLAGAFGGAGGQSAFGTRAGDVFTKITAVMAIIWVFLAGVSRFALEPASNQAAAQFKSEADLAKEKNPGGTIGGTPVKTGTANDKKTPPENTAPDKDDNSTDNPETDENGDSNNESPTPEPDEAKNPDSDSE